ncbi:MAG TPA: hypothetical protein VF065_15335, partial [Ilumatobacter sp.]
GGDAQYLFSTDILGYSDWWTPRHSKQYRDFRAEYARLQAEREGAFREFVADVSSGEYPQPEHVVPVADDVHGEFVDYLDSLS